ncbi:unnamed protein product [marine sediment metagenome]|uniref:Uncharacterized protein n=1 Tax=marine sediment metagenome TaxID=412755 RepID=X0ZQ96_9ZZZZ
MDILIRKILRLISGKNDGSLKDKMTFRDDLKITMRYPDGSIFKQWEEKANTWITYGKGQIRDALDGGGFTAIGFMYCTAGAGSSEEDTTNSTPAADKARFIATWASAGAITGITKFAIRQVTSGSALAEISCTSFDKPDGISLEITWDTTIS